MTMAVRVHIPGGPEAMQWERIPTPEPGPGEALVRHEAIGLNYTDVYFRTGLYKTTLPAILGMEAAGTVIQVGPGVDSIYAGDRVAYASGPIGSYATERTISADRLIVLPDDISTQNAAAMLLQGLTAHYLLRRTFPVRSGQVVLVHAAAGGVGLILCQWATALGARVIGVVSTPEKADIAYKNGAHEVIVGHERLVEQVAELTEGAMVPVVYDSVGRETFLSSLDCLSPLGLMVSYGNASGPVGAVDLGLLAAKGSLFLTRPTLATYVARRADLVAGAADLFEMVRRGSVRITIGQMFALSDARAAHTALEARRTIGSTILLP